jgi:integrase
MQSTPLLDRAGRRRSPATLASFHEGRSPHNKGLRYPPDPPSVEEIIATMRTAGDDLEGLRLRAVIIVLWRAGLRISEALALAETDLDRDRGAILVRHGKGGKRREVGMDRDPTDLAGRIILLRPARTNTRTPMRARRHQSPAPPHRRGRRSQTPIRAAPAPTRARCRDVPRRRSARRHPATTRTRRSRCHLRLPTRD